MDRSYADRYYIALDDYGEVVGCDDYPVDSITLECFIGFKIELHLMNWVMVF